MGKKLRPAKGFERIDSIWSWFERFGVIKAALTAIIGAGITTWIVALFQSFPRWLVLALVFLVATILILAFIAVALWAAEEIKTRFKDLVNQPLRRRVTALEQSLAPRRLKPEQRVVFQEELAKRPGRIRIIAIHQDDDANRFAEDFVEVLKAAHWDIWGIDSVYETNMVFQFYGDIGLFLFTNTTGTGIDPYPPAQKLAEIFETTGIQFRYYTSYEISRDCCELVVGHRGEP